MFFLRFLALGLLLLSPVSAVKPGDDGHKIFIPEQPKPTNSNTTQVSEENSSNVYVRCCASIGRRCENMGESWQNKSPSAKWRSCFCGCFGAGVCCLCMGILGTSLAPSVAPMYHQFALCGMCISMGSGVGFLLALAGCCREGED